MDATSVIAAFSEDQVERLTGLSRSQLRYWDRTGFFSPDYADPDRRLAYSRLYSFRDIVALRTLNVLRNQHNVPLQHLRKVAEKLVHLERDLWTRTTLYIQNKRVVFHEPESGKPQEVLSGQYVLKLPLKVVVSDMRSAARAMLQRGSDSIGQIEQHRHVNHNAWVVSGTRIPTAAIRRFYEAGYSEKEIQREYPDLTMDDVRAALTHERKLGNAA